MNTAYTGYRPDMVTWLPDHYAKVLEIGCADGQFRKAFDPACEYWGVEPDSKNAGLASKHLTKVLVGVYQDVHAQLPDNYFDLVICNDVIEHMQDHDLFFEMIKSKITHDAYLVGSVPNIRYIRTLYELLIKKDWNYSEMGVLDRTHLRYFTEQSLKKTFMAHGFVIDRLHGIKSTLANSASARNMIKNILIRCLILATLGYYSDIQYPQFGFLVRCPKY